ncbi:porin family protein [Aestuariibacter sp. AA17]|uniref:Porin family protein n=1 Tax=Fluctibacter corallii TaxID=2984329 RepID=A0ABT3ACB9_9ALTE|nr:porin family protein [Aestuariibacter sp. AA17]MCV2886320.1 porin family protein [Aestuariibacter sp. AA17]
MKSKLLLLSALLSLGFQAHADESQRWHLGLQYSFQDISVAPDRKPEAVGVVGGYRISEYFTLEARYNVGSSGYSSTYLDGNEGEKYKEEIDTQAMLLIKASYPIFDSVSVYALVGVSDTRYEFTVRSYRSDIEGNTTEVVYPYVVSHKEKDFTYGLGVTYRFSDSVTAFLDHQILPELEIGDSPQQDWSATNIGVTYSF